MHIAVNYTNFKLGSLIICLLLLWLQFTGTTEDSQLYRGAQFIIICYQPTNSRRWPSRQEWANTPHSPPLLLRPQLTRVQDMYSTPPIHYLHMCTLFYRVPRYPLYSINPSSRLSMVVSEAWIPHRQDYMLHILSVPTRADLFSILHDVHFCHTFL